jgi:hypothetical protein
MATHILRRASQDLEHTVLTHREAARVILEQFWTKQRSGAAEEH